MGGPTVVPGYWRRPEAAAETFADGWLRSGDLGRIDDDGFLYIVDRAKDMVIRGGENIAEASRWSLPSTSIPPCSRRPCSPSPTTRSARRSAPWSTSSPGATAAGEELAPTAPRRWPVQGPACPLDQRRAAPRGGTGKLQKRELKAEYLAGHGQSGTL